MGIEIVEPNTCFRGCCHSQTIPLYLHPSSYTILGPIARGAESVVYEGILDGKRVAVKKPVLSTAEDMDKFHKELQLLCKLDHPGLATLVAAHAKPPNYMFFFEFYESQSLAHQLHVEEWSPDIDQVLDIAMHLAKALQYLHKHGIVHRDVKPANILLDKNFTPHLSDFGLAMYKENLKQVFVTTWKSSGKPTGGFHKKNMVGTLIYMAPEILRKEIHSEKSDVYSFAVSINELLTGVVPYTDLRAETQAHTVLEMNYTEQQLTAAVVSDGLRPTLEEKKFGVSENMLSLIQRCWDSNPLIRPSLDDIIAELDPMVESRKCRAEKDQRVHEDNASSHTSNTGMPSLLDGVDWSSQGQLLSKSASLAKNSISWPKFSADGSEYQPKLSWGCFATCGKRESMEDTHFLLPYMCNEEDVHAFGIFDGHRGAAAAKFSSRALPGFLQTHCSTCSPTEALVQAFISTDATFREELDTLRKTKGVVKKNWHPGCTALVALIVRNMLFVANAGDCRIILCRAGKPVALSQEHLASLLEERERVIGTGGEVRWLVDTWRVGPAALQVTRSIGDDDLKPAVTAEPEITETTLTEDDEYMVMASDGLWDLLSGEDVVSIIRDTVKEPGMCSRRLATEAAERGSKDNITSCLGFVGSLIVSPVAGRVMYSSFKASQSWR